MAIAQVSVVDNQITVDVSGTALLAPLVASATASLAATIVARDATLVAQADIVDRIGAFRVVPFYHATYSHAFVDDADNVFGFIERAGGKWLINLAADASVSLGGITGADIGTFSGWHTPFHDASGNIMGGWRPDGSFVASLSSESIVPEGAVSAAVAALLATSRVSPPASRLFFSGDSLTAGAGGGGTTYPAVMAAALGLPYVNTAVGGTTSSSIGVRQGGIPFTISITGASLPAATTEVTVTAYSAEITNNQSTQEWAGTLLGIPVTVTRYGQSSPNEATTDYYTVKRQTAAGGATAIANGSTVLLTIPAGNETDVHYIQAGQNDGRNTRAERLIVRDNILRMVDRIGHDRFGIIGVKPNSVADTTFVGITDMNELLEQTFGWHFIKTYEYLGSAEALADAGITPTGDDTTHTNAGAIPPSLRSDAVHGNADYYTLEGDFMARWHRGHGFPIGS